MYNENTPLKKIIACAAHNFILYVQYTQCDISLPILEEQDTMHNGITIII